MSRVTCAPASRKRRKRWLKRAKGFFGDRKGHIRQVKNAVMKAESYSTEHRRRNKNAFRSLWIVRLNVAARMHGISYSKLIFALNKANCQLNRKMLSELAIHDPAGFKSVVDEAKTALAR